MCEAISSLIADAEDALMCFQLFMSQTNFYSDYTFSTIRYIIE